MRWGQALGWAVGVGAAAVGAIAVAPWEWFHSQDEIDRSLLRVEAVLDADGCPRGKPLVIRVKNGSSRAIRRVDFALGVYERGNSENLADFIQPEWTLIVSPWETVEGCAPVVFALGRVPPKDPVVRIGVRRVDFYAEGEAPPK